MAGYKKNLTNPYLYKQFSNSVADMYDYTMTNLMDGHYDNVMASSTDGTFKAVCLSGIRTGDNGGSGPDANDASIKGDFIEIIVRPLTPFGSILPNPAAFTNPKEINDAISTHKAVWLAKSDFESKDQSSISFGQVINCYFENGSIENSDFSGLRFAEPQGETYDDSILKLASIKGVAASKCAFDKGNPSLLGSPSKEPPNEDIITLAERFDNESSGYKSRNSWFIAKLHPEFQPYIKAFIIKCKDSKIIIYINSGYRTRAEQDRLLSEHNAGRKPFIKPASTSYHMVGMAIDCNPVEKGKWINTDSTKQEWTKSGAVAIGQALGLRWGGDFSNNYDPVHFDFGNKVSKTRMKAMITEAKTKDVQATTLPSGSPPLTAISANEQPVLPSDPYATSEQGEVVDPYATSDRE